MSRYQLGLLAGAVVLIAGVIWWQAGGTANGQVVDVKVPELSGVEIEGENLFNAKCASCHGRNAAGSDKGPPLVHIYYEPGHHGDGAFYVAALTGARQHHWKFGNMPKVEGIDEAGVAKVIAYVRAMQRNNGIH